MLTLSSTQTKPSPNSPQTPLDFNYSRSSPMTTQTTAATSTTPAAPTALAPPSQPLSSASAALKSLRLPPNYGATLGVKKLLTLVPVGKPKKPQFFRTHTAPEMTFAAMLLEQKESRESYVVLPDVGVRFKLTGDKCDVVMPKTKDSFALNLLDRSCLRTRSVMLQP